MKVVKIKSTNNKSSARFVVSGESKKHKTKGCSTCGKK
jgi:hypothetical protein